MIDIVMATYNGVAYVKEQLESILAQTNHDWRLIVCDDGSTDGTTDVLALYADRYPERIVFYENAVNSGGAGANFMNSLRHVTSEYVMFCDQDDVWLPNKIELTYRAMCNMERRYGRQTPICVHTDLLVVDEQLQTIAPSLMCMQKLEGAGRTFTKQLSQNCVTGCTMMMNRALVALAEHKHPAFFVMHDWWMSLLAAGFGVIGFVNIPLIRYRQHGKNAEGAKDFTGAQRAISMAGKGSEIRASLNRTYEQAKEFMRLYAEELTEEKRSVLQAYCSLPLKGKVHRVITALRYGFGKTGLVRKLGYYRYL